MNYYYLDANGQQQGPVSIEQLAECGITPATMVWAEGMPQWQTAGSVPELATLFAQQAPVLPPTPSAPAPPKKSNKPLIIGGIVAGVLIIGAVVFFLTRGGHKHVDIDDEDEVDYEQLAEAARQDSIRIADSIRAAEEEAARELQQQEETVSLFLKEVFRTNGGSESFIRQHCSDKALAKVKADGYGGYDGEDPNEIHPFVICGGALGSEEPNYYLSKVEHVVDNIYNVILSIDKSDYDYSVKFYKGRRVVQYTVDIIDGNCVIDDYKTLEDFKYK